MQVPLGHSAICPLVPHEIFKRRGSANYRPSSCFLDPFALAIAVADDPTTTGRAKDKPTATKTAKEPTSMDSEGARVNGRLTSPRAHVDGEGEGARIDGRINGWLKVHNPVHVGLASTKGIAASAGPVGRIKAASYSSSRNSGANESCVSSERTKSCRHRWGTPSSDRSSWHTKYSKRAGVARTIRRLLADPFALAIAVARSGELAVS